MKKLGIYGGTFNPPHLGHRAAAEHFLSELSLDRLLIIPDFLPPHKASASMVGEDDRLFMCRLNFSDLPKTEISDLEIRRGGMSYTYETVEALASPDRKLYLLVGTDMFLSFDRWKYPERILAKAALVCMRREADASLDAQLSEKKKLLEEKFCADVVFLRSEAYEASSSEIRSALTTGKECPILRDTVASYIREKGLYR